MMAIYCTLVVVLGKALYTHYLSKSQHPCEVDTVNHLPFTQRETEAQRKLAAQCGSKWQNLIHHGRHQAPPLKH